MSTDTREALAAMPTDAQVVAAARVLNKRAAEACNVDEEDSWKTYGEEYKDDAREALRAALATQPAQPSTELLRLRAEAEALRKSPNDEQIKAAVDAWFDTQGRCTFHERMRAAIAATKEQSKHEH